MLLAGVIDDGIHQSTSMSGRCAAIYFLFYHDYIAIDSDKPTIAKASMNQPMKAPLFTLWNLIRIDFAWTIWFAPIIRD